MKKVFYASRSGMTKDEVIEEIKQCIADGSFEELSGTCANIDLLTDEKMQKYVDDWREIGDDDISEEVRVDSRLELLNKLADEICR